MNRKQYPVLLFTISRGDQVVGLYCVLHDNDITGDEEIRPISDNAAELVELLNDRDCYTSHIVEYESEYDCGDLEDAYYRAVEVARSDIQRDFPELILGKIEIARNWGPDYGRILACVNRSVPLDIPDNPRIHGKPQKKPVSARRKRA